MRNSTAIIMGRRFSSVVLSLACSTAICAAFAGGTARAADVPAAAPRVYTEGQKVEVREGDDWSAATVLKHEGRKYQIHYEGGDATSDEWVTADRIRAPGSGGAPAAVRPAAGAPADAGMPKPLAKPKPKTEWKLHTTVEVKHATDFRKATILNRRGDWYLINYENGPWEEWVEPWRIRAIGSKDDPFGWATPNRTIIKGNKIGDPPTPQPGPPPEAQSHEAGSTTALESPNTPLTPTDRGNEHDIVFGGGEVDALKLPPDAQAKPAKAPLLQPLVLKGSTGEFFDRAKGLYFTGPETGLAAIVHSDEPPGKPAAVRVERLDLATGQSQANSSLPATGEPLDVSPDGKFFLSRSNVFGFGGSGRLDLWELNSPVAAHVASFMPFDNQQPVNRDIKWARFVDSDHVIVMSGNGLISLWEAKTAKEIWSAEADAQCIPALSANNKYLAVAIKGDEIVVAEALSGKTLGRLSTQTPWSARLSFKPDGTQLAAAGPDVLTVWDLGTGKRAYDLTPVGCSGGQIAWPANGFVLLDGQSLVSLEKKMVVWTYQGENGQPGLLGSTYAGRYWYIAGGARAGKPALVSVMLPHEQAFHAAVIANPERDLIVHPGSSIAIDVNVAGEIQEKASAGLKARVTDNGVKIVENNAPAKLVAKTEAGETREVEYRGFGAGPFGPPSKISVTGTKYDIHIETPDGKILWQRVGGTYPPPMVMMKQGQSVEQAVADAVKPRPEFFANAHIPKYVPKSKTGLGVSRLTAAGIQNANVPL